MKLLTSQIGKYLFLVPMVLFGLLHFVAADQMAGMVPIPGGVIWVYLTGAALIAAAVAVFINHPLANMALLLLGAMLLIFALSIHLPNMIGGDESALGFILKDVALAGGAWTLADRYEAT